MANYPKPSRHLISDERANLKENDRLLAQEFNYEYFDGSRLLGLGGYEYINDYWKNTCIDFINYYKLDKKSSLLDVGCGKGFTLFEFCKLIPQLRVRGLEISNYCLNNSLPVVKPNIDLGCCSCLPYESNSFDLAISIATIHNLDINGVKRSLKELIRVSKKSFIKINGFRNESEKDSLNKWNLVAKTILHVSEWEKIFDEVGYDREWEFFYSLNLLY